VVEVSVRAVRVAARGAALAVAISLTFGAFLTPAGAQQDQAEPQPALLLILDSSGSMLGNDGTGQRKIAAAKRALNRVVDSLPDDSLVGLRVYGHRIPNTDKRRGCKDTELIQPVDELDRPQMKARIRSYQAKGFTPIGLSLLKGAADLKGQEGKKTIVLVSDGIDTCAPPPPCKIARQIVAQGIDLRIDTVGFQVDPAARKELKCIARVGKGTYVDAASADDLANELERLSIRALRTYETAGTAVEGTSSYAGAPTVLAGQYTDAISPGTEKWYSFELAEGQSADISITIVGDPRSENVGDARGVVVTPELDDTDSTALIFDAGPTTVSGAILTPEVGSGFPFETGGTYYLKLELRDDTGGAAAGEELPVELLVDILGEPVESSPSPSPETETDDSDDSEDSDSAAGPSLPPAGDDDALLMVAGSGMSLLAGAALGALLTRRFRRGARA
jgi:Ca-activated chloride channel family protein